MREPSLHIPDDELLLSFEDELAPDRAREVTQHLAWCATCNERSERLKVALSDFSSTYREAIPPNRAPSSRSRESLASAIASQNPQPPAFGRLADLRWGLALASALLAATAVLGLHYFHQQKKERAQREYAQVVARPLPDTRFTPGAVRTISSRDVCGARAGELRLNVSPAIQSAVFQEYGMPNAKPQNYELDYLITPELGGADDIRNLWPEPYSQTEWNAHVKDQLEDYLYQQVCEGRIDLSTAQRDIASNWVSAYKQYFHTEEPLPVRPSID